MIVKSDIFFFLIASVTCILMKRFHLSRDCCALPSVIICVSSDRQTDTSLMTFFRTTWASWHKKG